MREICFDTETTGLEANNGDRVIELGCVEIVNLIPTGREFHRYINPQRSVSADTIRITGITDDMLVGKPHFDDPDVYQAFLDFIGDARLVAHNAEFDRGFINAELARVGIPELPKERFVDTLVVAKERFPGANNSLDGLCKRFNVSLEARDLHGAVLDSRLLAEVYLELQGGRARVFDFGGRKGASSSSDRAQTSYAPLPKRPEPLKTRLNADERAAHLNFVKSLGDNALWRGYLTEEISD